MGLASRWAEDPELVELAEQQDRKVVTSKKGQPLVSKWADVNDEEEVKELDHVKDVEAKKERRHSPSKRGRADHFSSGIDSIRLSKLSDDDLLEVPHDQDDTQDKIAPTKAAAGFAARLGISLTGNDNHKSREQERRRNRERKMKDSYDWKRGKDDISLGGDLTMNGQNEPNSFENVRDQREKISKRVTGDHKNREPISFRRNLKKKKEPEVEEDKPFDQEEFDRFFAKEKQLNQDIANGKRVDWADFGDDDF